jgi:hypothetical protein
LGGNRKALQRREIAAADASANAESLATGSPVDEQRFEQRIAHQYFVRFHMGLILAAVIASGVLASKLLLDFRVHSMRVRYPVAILGSYLVFLLLVRVWIWYVSRTKSAAGVSSGFGSGNLDGSLGGGGGSGPFRFGGGSSGGAGASDSWGEAVPVRASAASTGSGSGGSRFNFGLDSLDIDDDFVILLLLALLVVSIVIAGGYLIYAAPSILPEAAWQAVLASTLTKVTKRVDHDNWVRTVLRASAIPFIAVLLFAGALGWAAHHHCPNAVKLHEALFCTVSPPQ